MHFKRDKLLIAVVAIVIAIMCVLAASSAAHAETKDGIPVILITDSPENAEKVSTIDFETAGVEVQGQDDRNAYKGIVVSQNELEELRWVLALEAQGEGLRGEIACCEVIFNRYLSGRWGNGIHGVLTMRGQFAAYRYIGSRKAWAVPGEMENEAIQYCLANGLTILPDTAYVYFDTGRKNGKRNIKIGHHWFGAES